MSTTKGHSNIPSTAVEFAPGLWRTSLQRYDLSVSGREMIQSRVDIEPDSPPIRHTHPGEEIIYVLEGPLEYQIDGQPDRVVKSFPAVWSPVTATENPPLPFAARTSFTTGFMPASLAARSAIRAA